MSAIITIEQSGNELWVFGDEGAEHKDYEEQMYTLPRYGEAVLARDAADEYANAWAAAVGGTVHYK